MSKRAAIYGRVSTGEQSVNNQLFELRRYVGERGWQLSEYVNEGVSGAKERRPELAVTDQVATKDDARGIDQQVDCRETSRVGW
jgi:hypothetical protein